ncbi:coiled-coil domain-containing protein 62 [Antennarius striatus]|uniref:coiled-coil domain-containing protein 62 n=1 Tax=Antennarius striatus TaxID=241820 RepID=UPI0035B35D39
MGEDRRLSVSSGGASVWFPWSEESSTELWHSTPLKTKNGAASLDAVQPSVQPVLQMDGGINQWAKCSSAVPADLISTPSSQDNGFPVNDRSGFTIQRQRRELQLLMAELKDRDRELNTMAASHHKHLHSWEQDRQRVLTLEQKCAHLDDEMQKRNEVIKVLTKRVWVVETKEEEIQKELSAARQQLCELEQKQQHISQRCEDFEEQNQSLNSTIVALSTKVGSLQVREEELSTMLKLKDKDVTEASGQVIGLTGSLQDLERTLLESRSRETKLLRDSEEYKRRYKEAKHEITRLKEELQWQLMQSSAQREEMIRLKQELQLIHRDLALSGDGASWKDELLELARSKQERTMSELRYLRQVCENQRNDLQLLQLNLESAHETLREKTGQGLPRSQDELRCGCLDKGSSPSLGVKNSRHLHDAEPAASLRCLSLDLDGDDPLTSCSLQQLLDESRLVIRSSKPPTSGLHSGTTDPCHRHQCHCHSTLLSDKAGETTPRDSPRHQPDT